MSMKIEAPAREVTSRGPRILQFLRPLAERPSELFVSPKPAADEYIAAVHERHFGNTGVFNSLRFRTIAPKFLAMYHERWKRFYRGKDEFYYLFRAYLHIYQVDKEKGEVEFLLLHCDPNEPNTAAHAKYKQSLHLHIECTEAEWPHDIWPHAHIALNTAYLSTMLKDANSITHAIEIAAVMLKDQVLEELRKTSVTL